MSITEKKIGDAPIHIGDGNYSAKYPKASEFLNSGVPFFSASDFDNGRLSKLHVRYISEHQHSTLRKGHLKANDILIVTRGNGIGKVVLVDKEYEGANINAQLALLRVDEKELHSKYLYYLLSSPEYYKILTNYGSGSAQPQLTITSLQGVPLKYPRFEEQLKIASILEMLDAKCFINNQINSTLKQLAQTIFNSWFVDFDPVHAKKNALEAGLTKVQAERAAMAVISGLCAPTEYAENVLEMEKKLTEKLASIGKEKAEELQATVLLFSSDFENSELGEIPLGSKIVPIYDLISVTGGGTPKRSESSYWDGNIPWFSIRDIKEDGITIIETVEKITDLGLKKSSTNLLPIGTTIITARGTVGKLALIRIPMAMNQSCYGVYPVKGLGPIFNYFNLNEVIHILKRNSHGAVFDTINHSTFQTCKVVFSGPELAQIFEKISTPLIDKMENNQRETSSLIQLRDTLLPKLLAGEIDLSGVSID